MILTDLAELKVTLAINPLDTSQDTKLLIFAEYATDLIEEFLDRKLTKRARTEFYQGTSTRKLLLRNRPVYLSPLPRCWVATNGQFQASPDTFEDDTEELVYGESFALDVDSDDASSRKGILLRLNQYWERNVYRNPSELSPYIGASPGSIKVVYTGGYTVDTLPGAFRLATNLLIARLNQLFPFGMLMTSESYEERNVSWDVPQKDKLMSIVKEILYSYRNWSW